MSAPQLTFREWIGAGTLTALFVLAVPRLWPAPRVVDEHRVPFALSEDYWGLQRWAERAATSADVILLGDSVIWGAYAPRDETLAAFLTRRDGRRFANLGFNGAHPAALAGMLRHHGGAIRASTVVLHCNLLWLSSPRRDLSDAKESVFNHAALVPQLFESIPVYRASLEERLGIAVAQRVPFLAWTRHVQQAHFDQRAIPSWTVEHPYSLVPAPARVPATGPAERPVSWTDRGIAEQSFDWVPLADSVQWRFFREAVRLLRARGNRVIILLGPFNVHLLQPGSRPGLEALRRGVARWARANDLDLRMPEPLPSGLYADASHPLAQGYRLLAERVEIPR